MVTLLTCSQGFVFLHVMKKTLVFIVFSMLLICCKQKEKADGDDDKFISVNSYLKAQVAEMDSSLATIMAIRKLDTVSTDTTYLKREDFKIYANEFLQLPDISSSKLKDDYSATNMYDDLLNAYVFTYTTTDQKNEIKKEDVIVDPTEAGESNIRAINIDKWQTHGDSTVHKNMLWETGKRFLIITKVAKPSQPERISTVEVKWSNTPEGF